MNNNNKSFFGFYRGTVVQQLNNGFCKIAIPGVLYYTNEDGGLDISKLPPAECASEPFGGTLRNGTYKYPDIQSVVWCFFEAGNINKPVYFASANSGLHEWDSSAVSVQSGKTIDGYSLAPVTSVGKVSRFADSSITQTTSIDKTNKVVGSKIKLDVGYTPENAEIKAKEEAALKDSDVDYGVPTSSAASITLDNLTNKLTITAADTIEIKAPNIIFNSTKLGKPGTITIRGGDITLTADEAINMLQKSLSVKSEELINLVSKRQRRLYL